MRFVKIKGKWYEVDPSGFLVHFHRWDEEFARSAAHAEGIPDGLTQRHWDVILFLRRHCLEGERCARVHETCAANGLTLKELKELFPSGYLRGACKIAGVSYAHSHHPFTAAPLSPDSTSPPAGEPADEGATPDVERTYLVDVRGFLVDPSQWDEQFAVCRAADMKMLELTARHWEIIRLVRSRFEETGAVPTVYETCEAAGIEIEELGELFPDGYHRGAVKMAGLRVL